MKEDEMDRTCSTYGPEEEYMQRFGFRRKYCQEIT
jgi:hypothetical protein